MATSLLKLTQQAFNELGLTAPNAVSGSSSNDVIQALALLNGLGLELVQRFAWQALTKEYRFTLDFSKQTGSWTKGEATVTGLSDTSSLDATYIATGEGINQDTYIASVDSSTQVTLSQNVSASQSDATIYFAKTKYSLPSDYDRLNPRTQWDKSKHWEMLGPETAQEWQWLKSGFIAVGPRIRFRILGNYFQIWPPTDTGEYLGFEYLSNNWVIGSDGTSKSAFNKDDDTCIFKDRLMILGLKKLFWEVKGFDATAYEAAYEPELERSIAQDASAETLAMSPKLSTLLIGWDQIPDTGYGST